MIDAAYTKLVSGLLFPLHERIKGHRTVAVRRELERTQWLSTAELEVLQLQRLRGFLADVQAHVPNYRDQFAALGFDPVAVDDLKALSRLPLLTKADIRGNMEALKADDHGALARFNTGGSSGEPLVFLIGKERVSHDVAAKWRATRWWGVDIGDRECVVWGSPIELGAQDRLRAVRDRVLRTRLLPAFAMSEQNLSSFVKQIKAFRPRMLFGYPSSLALIARHAEAGGTDLADCGIRVAFVTSERLYDHQRADIERVFGCPVANGYGGRDAGFIAHACPQGQMHLTAEDIVVEILDDQGQPLPPGELGEIVVTHLATRDFPFIRYRTGDIGALGNDPCPCGRGLPVLQRLEGRSTDFITAVDGTKMHGLALIYVLRDLSGIDEFRIIQESLLNTEVQIKAREPLGHDLQAQIRREFRRRLGEQVEVRITHVDQFPVTPSGKFRYVTSAVGQSEA